MAFEFKPFSPKQLDAMTNADAFINIFEGAVRSGKTIASIIAWCQFVQDSPHSEFLMSGNTTDTLYRNVIADIEKIYGKKRVKYNAGAKGGAQLVFTFRGKGRKIVKKVCYCRGASNERSENGIRGMTVGGWYADEITIHAQSFVKQALNRMSLSGARALWTTNPDSPHHYIKTEFIDKAAAKGYKVWSFILEDNLALPPEYVENIKNAYSGLWYKRMILGLWVLADGVIYDGFSEETMVVDELPRILKYWIGCDYGTSNPTVFILAGLGEDGRLYIIDEYYHSGTETGRQKSPKQYSADIRAFIEKHGIVNLYENIFIDPSAEGFIVTLWQDGVKRIAQADNTVLRGIELVSNIIGLDKFRVHRRCKNVLKEMAAYSWDPKAQERGEDKPLKTSDHTLDSIRYIANGTRRIWTRRTA